MIYEDLKGKKVLVTGSSSGIGAVTAAAFAKQGAVVGVHYFRTEDGAKKTLQEVKNFSDGQMYKADMREKDQVTKMIDSFAEEFGGVDILVNNAGNLIKRYNFDEAPVEYHKDMYDTNVLSVLLATQGALGYLKKSKGNIVNISSLAAHLGGGGGSGLYAGAKAAVATETIAMAREFAPDIRVNSVFPGFVETRFHERFSTKERAAKIAEMTPLKRNGTAEDIANAILFLASDAASWMTGAYIAVNGGFDMRY